MPGACREKKECIGSPGIGITDGYEPPCECWEVDLGLLQEQSALKWLSHLSSSNNKTFLKLK